MISDEDKNVVLDYIR